jgi:hypothetical protein
MIQQYIEFCDTMKLLLCTDRCVSGVERCPASKMGFLSDGLGCVPDARLSILSPSGKMSRETKVLVVGTR